MQASPTTEERVRECIDVKRFLKEMEMDNDIVDMKQDMNEYVKNGVVLLPLNHLGHKPTMLRCIEAMNIKAQLQQLGCLVLPNINKKFRTLLHDFLIKGQSCSDKILIDKSTRVEIRFCVSNKKSGIIMTK